MDKLNTSFGKTIIKAARKKHICAWCAETINVGEFYKRHTGVWDNAFQSNPMHDECAEAFDRSSECEYYLHDNQRGISLDEVESFWEGKQANEEGHPREAPQDVVRQGDTFVNAWLRGWDEAKAESEATDGS